MNANVHLRSLSPSSVRKKLKDRSFAARVKRDDVYGGVERLGANLDEHIQLVLDALAPHAEALGIGGEGRQPTSTRVRPYCGICRREAPHPAPALSG